MNIVIVGDGKVGYALSEQLGREGHNIIIIDSDLQALNNTMEALDVIGVHGNGATRQVQLEAGVQDADILIAATSTDEVNMLSCLLAKALGAKNTIARVRNPEYMDQLDLIREPLGLSLAINPEFATARAIARVIKFPRAAKVDVFAKGRVELIEFRLPEDSPIIGKRLMDLPVRAGAKILVCAIERQGEVHIPNGSFVIERGDKLHITGESHAITVFLSAIGGVNFKIRSLMIVGGGRIGYYLARMLDHRHFRVKMVEKDSARCDRLCELLPHVEILHGDGSEVETLESEGLDNVDAFVAVTDMDEENLIMSMMADHKQVPKVVAKVNRLDYFSVVERLGIDTVVSPKLITAGEITRYVRAMQNTSGEGVETLYQLVNGKAEALEFRVGREARHLGETLIDMPIKPNLLLAAIVRSGKVIIPGGGDHFAVGDSVVVISGRHRLSCFNDIFEN